MKPSNQKPSKEATLKHLYAQLDKITKELQQCHAEDKTVPNALLENLHSVLKKLIASEDK